jgi:hypothetical protein
MYSQIVGSVQTYELERMWKFCEILISVILSTTNGKY